MTEICQILLMVSVAYGQGRMRGMYPPPAILKNILMYAVFP